jgi:ferredoxin
VTLDAPHSYATIPVLPILKNLPKANTLGSTNRQSPKLEILIKQLPSVKRGVAKSRFFDRIFVFDKRAMLARIFMSDIKPTDLQTYLSRFTESDWLAAVDELLPSIHEVDRNAVQIWFRFYPLGLTKFVAEAQDRDDALRGLALQGDFELKDQIDTSHHFLYGHRYWKTVKCKIDKVAGEFTGEPSLAEIIKDVAMCVAKKHNVERALTTGIAAVGLATLNQVGVETFRATPGDTAEPKGLMKKSPDTIVAERANDDSQGLFGFLKTIDKKFSVSFTGCHTSGKFPIINEEEIATASQQDKTRDWQAEDPRCWEGPVPIECTAASCGTCWIGVLGGQEKLTEVGRRERRQMKVFGYNQPDEAKPFLRLACQARATGNVTIVIPPWNGVFGKKVYGNVGEVELEPVTTSAKHLRDTIASVTSGK